MPHAIVIRAAGTNCDHEMVRGLSLAGATVDLTHVDRLIAEPQRLDEADIVALPGGFSYGDDIASGRIFAVKLRQRLYPALRSAAQRGAMMFGACNGFQIMVQAGLLPGPIDGSGQWPSEPPAQEVVLTFNAAGRFQDRWVGVKPDPTSRCIWTAGLAEQFAGMPDAMQLPIAHGEGRFVAASPAVLERLKANGQVALRYTENPNGSEDSIAGICDASGRIFGLMPHPERYLDWTRHPYWTRLPEAQRRGDTLGLAMLRNAVRAVATASV